MRRSNRLSLGPRIPEVPGAAGETDEMAGGEAAAATEGAALRERGPEDVWSLRCPAERGRRREARERHANEYFLKSATSESWALSHVAIIVVLEVTVLMKVVKCIT